MTNFSNLALNQALIYKVQICTLMLSIYHGLYVSLNLCFEVVVYCEADRSVGEPADHSSTPRTLVKIKGQSSMKLTSHLHMHV